MKQILGNISKNTWIDGNQWDIEVKYLFMTKYFLSKERVTDTIFCGKTLPKTCVRVKLMPNSMKDTVTVTVTIIITITITNTINITQDIAMKNCDKIRCIDVR